MTAPICCVDTFGDGAMVRVGDLFVCPFCGRSSSALPPPVVEDWTPPTAPSTNVQPKLTTLSPEPSPPPSHGYSLETWKSCRYCQRWLLAQPKPLFDDLLREHARHGRAG